MEQREHEKVYVDLPGHWYTGGESLWAMPLGNDLFELRNVPFAAYGLNYGDIVRATSDDQKLKPEIREVFKPSGHKTLRLFFTDSNAASQQPHLARLAGLGASVERATQSHLALDIPPDCDYQSVCEVLSSLEHSEVLECETCEVRVPGSFTSAENE